MATIYKWFLMPLTRFKPQTVDLTLWWDHLFHVSDRTFQQFEVKNFFRMPGLYFERPSVKIQGAGERKVFARDRLVVRFDASAPDAIDVELIRDDHSETFQLTGSEWRGVQPYLRPLGGWSK